MNRQFLRLRRILVAFLAALVIFSVLGFGAQAASSGPNTPEAPNDPNIVGGTEAQPGAWPWQALVLPGGSMCGGSLVNAEWVLTAAHCFFDDQNNQIPPGQVTVRLGVHNMAVDPAEGQQFNVTSVTIHPDYLTSNKERGDVALVRLAQPATLNASVALVTLATEADASQFAPGVMATVTGWGATSQGGPSSNVLKQVNVPVVSKETCSQNYPNLFDSHLCAGGNAGEDSCQGDSGGPLVAPNAGQTGFLQIGVVSFGQGCAQAGVPGVYERVASYICWLNQTTGQNLGACQGQPPSTPTAWIYLPLVTRQDAPQASFRRMSR